MTGPPPAPDIPSVGAMANVAWPLALNFMMLQGIVVIDAWLVSSLGESAIAALGLSASIAGFALGLIFAFSTATQIRVAQAFGKGAPGFLGSVLRAGLMVNIAVAALGLLVLLAVGGAIVDALAHDATIATQAKRCLTGFAVVILAEAVGQCLGSFFNGCGKTRLPLYSYLLAIPLNVIVSVILIQGLYGAPALGVVGAVIGSAIAALFRAGFLCQVLSKERAIIAVGGATPVGAAFRRHLRFSAPIAATFASQTVANNVCLLLYATLPVNQFVALTLITPWIQVVGGVAFAWSQATGIAMAQLLGRGRSAASLDAFLSRVWRIALVAAAVVAAVYVAICLAAPWIYSALNRETQALLIGFLPVLALLPFPKGSNAICGQTLRASGDTVYVMHVFVWSQWLFRVPLTALMALYLEAPALWILALLPGEELVKFAPFHLRLFRGDWKTATIAP